MYSSKLGAAEMLFRASSSSLVSGSRVSAMPPAPLTGSSPNKLVRPREKAGTREAGEKATAEDATRARMAAVSCVGEKRQVFFHVK